MGRRALLFGCLAAATLAGAVLLAASTHRSSPARRARASADRGAPGADGALPVLWRMPAFSFPDQHGTPTATADLRGRVWIANFIFTHCTSICPLITAKMALLQRRLHSPDLRFVSFSVDPARDTPEVLRRYAVGWRPGETRWLLLGTTPAGLEGLAAAMYVTVKPSETDINHTRLFFLVDADGAVRGIYESDRNDAVERLIRDAEALGGGSPADSALPDAAASGGELYAALRCAACHARPELAPPLEGIQGRRVRLDGGAELTADAAYIREAIVAPDVRLVAGYATRMPSYAQELTPRQLDALVDHVGQLAATKHPAHADAAAAGATTDPVCAMKVRVVGTTPHQAHAGHTYFFCSERCRDRFVAEPGRYVRLARR
jgi:protein SCO1/2